MWGPLIFVVTPPRLMGTLLVPCPPTPLCLVHIQATSSTTYSGVSSSSANLICSKKRTSNWWVSTAIVRYKKPGRESRWQWILGLSPNHSSSGGWMSCLDESPRGKTKTATSKGVTPKGKFTEMAREMPGSHRFASDMETFSEIRGGTLRASRHLNKKHPKLSCQEAFGGLLFVQTTLILEIWFKSLMPQHTQGISPGPGWVGLLTFKTLSLQVVGTCS